MQEPYETPVDKAIREARERGELDNLPGAGKPLPSLGNMDDPDWWVKAYAVREGLDLSAAMPPVLALRKEAAGFPESVADLATEASVRAVLKDFNRRVKQDRLRPAVGPAMPIVAPTVDIEDQVARWRALRAASHPDSLALTAPPGEADSKRSWWARWRRPDRA